MIVIQKAFPRERFSLETVAVGVRGLCLDGFAVGSVHVMGVRVVR